MQLHVIEQGDLLAAIQHASLVMLVACFAAGVLGFLACRFASYCIDRLLDDRG